MGTEEGYTGLQHCATLLLVAHSIESSIGINQQSVWFKADSTVPTTNYTEIYESQISHHSSKHLLSLPLTYLHASARAEPSPELSLLSLLPPYSVIFTPHSFFQH